MSGGRAELLLETEILAELSKRDGGRVVDHDETSWESTAVIEYPGWFGRTKRLLIVVTSAGHIARRRI